MGSFWLVNVDDVRAGVYLDWIVNSQIAGMYHGTRGAGSPLQPPCN
jgi:hypothetical protein